jgi:predicted CXXCH cytochrome family protein
MGWRYRINQALSSRGRLSSLAVGLAVALVGVATSLPASAQLSAPLTTGISTTKHNMGSGGSFTNKSAATGTGATTEVCVFCHTPHAAEVARGPLWNRAAGTAAYVPYTSTTLTGGTRDATSGMGVATAPGAISLACLSCHDGTQALNAIINQPGSGLGTGTVPWAAGGSTSITGVAAVGAGAEGRSNDHPIGVKYAGGALVGAQTNGGYNQWSTAQINNVDAFWVEAAGQATVTSGRQKADMWLYARAGATTSNNEAFVECASCHDPHTSNTTFLRTKNDYSSVCLSCHIK